MGDWSFLDVPPMICYLRGEVLKHKMIRAFKFALSIVGLLVVTVGQASAGPIITVPTNLSPGDSYRLAFLTSDTIDATSDDINVYNTFVDGLGDLVIASDWRAIASTPTVDARDNTGTNPNFSVGVPISLLNDSLLANNNADLWDGFIINALEIQDTGASFASGVWTGSAFSGQGLAGFELGGSGVFVTSIRGVSVDTAPNWVSAPGAAQGIAFPLHAMSGELAVPGAV